MWETRDECAILRVPHNMAQARWAGDERILMLMGRVIEHAAQT